MIVCVPVTATGEIDPRWGRAGRIAVADVAEGRIARWDEIDVGWDRLHDESTEGSHHARVARFVQDNAVRVVVAHHMGDPMVHMLGQMGIEVRLGASGDARRAALAAVGADG